jgi:hypothetical protein
VGVIPGEEVTLAVGVLTTKVKGVTAPFTFTEMVPRPGAAVTGIVTVVPTVPLIVVDASCVDTPALSVNVMISELLTAAVAVTRTVTPTGPLVGPTVIPLLVVVWPGFIMVRGAGPVCAWAAVIVLAEALVTPPMTAGNCKSSNPITARSARRPLGVVFNDMPSSLECVVMTARWGRVGSRKLRGTRWL